MATVSASSTAAANGPRPPNAELPTPPNAPRGSRASFATLKRPCSPANPCLSFALLVTFCSAPVVYFYSALDTSCPQYYSGQKNPVGACTYKLMSAVEIEIERGDERNESSGMDLRCGLVFDSDIFAGMPK